MAISLSNGSSTLALADNLIWEDELAWDQVEQERAVSITGALIVEDWPARVTGRPITLVGGEQWVWMSRIELLALQAMGAPAAVQLTLIVHDGSNWQVTPRRDDSEPWLVARPFPKVLDSGTADPQTTTLYILERLRFVTI